MTETVIKADPISAPKAEREYYVVKTYVTGDQQPRVDMQIIDGPMPEAEAHSIRKLREDANPLNASYNVAFREADE